MKFIYSLVLLMISSVVFAYPPVYPQVNVRPPIVIYAPSIRLPQPIYYNYNVNPYYNPTYSPFYNQLYLQNQLYFQNLYQQQYGQQYNQQQYNQQQYNQQQYNQQQYYNHLQWRLYNYGY